MPNTKIEPNPKFRDVPLSIYYINQKKILAHRQPSLGKNASTFVHVVTSEFFLFFWLEGEILD